MAIAQLEDGRKVDTDKLPKGVTVKYGRIWNAGITQQAIELAAFSMDLKPPFGLGRFLHYKRFHQVTWPDIEWSSWTDLKMRAACENNVLGVVGCTSSAKSFDFAHLALTMWWAAPADTSVVIVSTTLESAKFRIWSHLRSAHSTAKWYTDDTFEKLGDPPGKITEHPSPMLRLTVDRGGIDGAANQTISVIPAGAATDTPVAVTKLQGIHSPRVVVLFDEIQSIGVRVITEALPNLFSNAEVWAYGFGNFASPADAMGIFCKPFGPNFPDGYNSVGEATQRWPINVTGKDGICIRIDGRQTPNKESYLKDGTERFPYLLKYSEVLEREAALARDPTNPFIISALYRQIYALPKPEGTEDTPYSFQAIQTFGATKKPQWVTEGSFRRVCGVDPSRTAGGDEFSVCFAGYGKARVPKMAGSSDMVERWVVAFLEWVSLETDEVPRAQSIARKLMEICQQRGVAPVDVAIDCTGADSFGDVVADVWSNDFIRTTWAGAASDLAVSIHDPRICKDIYDRKSSELWVVGSEFMRNFQLCGMSEEVAEQFSKRRVSITRTGKISVEDKATFKQSFGRSPDKCDSAVLALEVCRRRLGAMAGMEGLEAQRFAWTAATQKQFVTPVRIKRTGIRSMW